MKANWQAFLTESAGAVPLIGVTTASQAHQVRLALLLCAAGTSLLALVLWTSGRSR